MATALDISSHQQSLLELSIHKLQEEQVKFGIEPRLLRFVLINNALKSLQSHILKFDIDNEFGLFDSQSTTPTTDAHDSFLINTCNHGYLSSPVSPPTPVKVPRLDSTSPFSSHSPLLNSCIIPSLGCPEIDPDELDVPLLPPVSPFPFDDKSDRALPGKRKAESQDCDDDKEQDSKTPPTKAIKSSTNKSGRPKSLCLHDDSDTSNHSLTTSFNSIINLNLSSSSTDSYSSDESTSSLSPIDFSDVDVSLYDYDDKAALSLSQVAESTALPPTVTARNPSSSSLSISSSVKAYKAVDYTEPTSDSTVETEANSRTSPLATDTSNTTSLLPDSSEIDNLDEIDRIVSLLMT